MKLFKTINLIGLSIWIALVCCIGCSDEYEKNQSYYPLLSHYYLNPLIVDFNFDSNAQTTNTQIISEGVDWTLNNAASWLTISPTNGKETSLVTISAEQHLSGDTTRMSIITLESITPEWEYSRAFTVSQSAATPFLIPEIKDCSFSGTASTMDIGISSNSVWSITSNSNWMKAHKVSESLLKISVDDNPTNDYRTETIILSNKSGKHAINITQYPANVSASQTTIQTEKDAALFTLMIDSEIDWNATSSVDWIQLSPSEGEAGISELEISLTENSTINERQGYVYIYTGNHQKIQIKIIQRGLFLNVEETSISFTSDSETQEILIQSNTEWIISDYPDWLSLSETEGEGAQTITATPSVNNSTMSRSGKIIIKHREVALSHSIHIIQSGKTFNIEQTTLQFGVKASTQPIKIISELPWQSTISTDWISTDLTSGDGDATVQVSVTETQSYDERFGTIEYSVVDKDITVNVHQLAKYFTITNKAFNFSSKGGTAKLSFSSNESWKIQKEDSIDWVSLSDTIGEGNGNITITVADNPSVKERQGSLLINTSVGQAIKINLKQAARYLRADVKSLSYFAKGGTDAITISSDGEYKIETSADWIDIKMINDSRWNVSIPYNETAIIREGTITIQLTDLEEGELVVTIPVKQTYEGGIYIDRAFEEEINWDVTNENGFAISIKSYNMDSTWDSKHKDSIVIMKSEYTADGKYDSEDKDTTDVNKSDYSNEKDWN